MSKNDKAPKKDPFGRVRKIGEREEIVDVELTEAQLEEMRAEVMILLDDEETIEKRKDEAAKNFASQLKTNQLQRNELRRKITAKKVRKTIIVEEHLTDKNEVIRIRQDTGDKIGARTATPRELQEDLFQEKPETGETPPDETAGGSEGGDEMFGDDPQAG